MLLDKAQVMEFLPHRDPFLFVDSILDIDVSPCPNGQNPKEPKDLIGALVKAKFDIKKDMEILKGHFPGNPILPGVVQIEMMAQASAFLSIPLVGKDTSGVNVETLLLSVDKAKFRKPLTVGMSLDIVASLVKVRGKIASYDGIIFHEGVKISEATIMAKLDITKKEKL